MKKTRGLSLSKINGWLMEMQEDATRMTRGEFVYKYGKNYEYIWAEIKKPRRIDPFDDSELINK
jgi:hypothetical protein